MNANPYAARVAALTQDQFLLLQDAVRERACRDAVGVGTLSEAADEYRAEPPCPRCGWTPCPKDGRTAAGLRRHKCPACKTRFACTSGSVLEYCKKPLHVWVEFI